MNELDIKRHSFDMAKTRLKEFSEKTEAELAIDRVETAGRFFPWRVHKVTGDELNKILESIQGHLIDINSTNNKTIKEFREVYNALDALDKDYITSIVANVKAIEKTSNDVRMQQETLKQHNDKLATQQNKLDLHQVEIDKNVDNMKKIVTTLKVFKEKLDGYKHLTDIDKIWSDCKAIRNDIQVVSNSITALSKKTTNDLETVNLTNKNLLAQVNKEILTLQKEAKTYMGFFSDLSEKIDSIANCLNEQIPAIEKSLDFVSQMDSVVHLKDVDSIWEDVDKAGHSISNIENELQTVDNTIRQMQNHFDQVDEFIIDLNNAVDKSNKVIQEHQSDLKRIVSISEKHQDELGNLSKNQNQTKQYAEANRSLIAELQVFRNEVDSIEHIADVDYMWEQGIEVKNNLAEANNQIVSLQEKTTETDKVISDKTVEMQDKIVLLETKLKYAYYLAGGALGLAAVELVLALTGVI